MNIYEVIQTEGLPAVFRKPSHVDRSHEAGRLNDLSWSRIGRMLALAMVCGGLACNPLTAQEAKPDDRVLASDGLANLQPDQTNKIANEANPTLGLAAPQGAVILFDGSHFDHWKPFSFGKINRNNDQKEIQWKLVEGDAMQIAFHHQGRKRKQFICTKETFGSYRLHLEFQLPEDGGQGNSGIFFGPLYELQILDSAAREKAGLIHCGAIYQIRAPDSNAALPAGKWQTVDLDYKAAGFDKDGDRMESKSAEVTIRLNGKLIHKDFALKLRRNKYASFPEEPTSPIVLQEHGSPVKFRNIWLLEKPVKDKTKSD